MSAVRGHKHSTSVTQNRKAQLANAYNELGKELASTKLRVVGNYTLGKVIGEGAYGKVRMGTHRLTSTRVAIKQIPKSMSASLTREIHHHRQLHHPHITQMFEVIATESHIWIVTELCCGGELYDYLAEKGRLSESEARVIFGQLCLAVAYLHDNNIVHRDLKLENVLLDEHCRVKLGDFGFTREYEKGSFMETFCGTTGYASPEMLQGKKYQGPEVDVWSLGVILYCLLTGTLPFDDDNENIMRDMIIMGDFEDPNWLSIESRNLLKNILKKEPSSRLTIPQILSHSWFTTHALTYETDSPLPLFQLQSISDQDTATAAHKSKPSSFSSSPETSSIPITPSDDPFDYSPPPQRNTSETTLKKASAADLESFYSKLAKSKQDVLKPEVLNVHTTSAPPPLRINSSGSSKVPPVHALRTPARTKRRSVSSTLSDPSASPTAEKSPLTPIPFASNRDVDFVSLLATPAPIIFSTPPERQLLNTLSILGFDTAQIVHSVLTDACDATGAVWWMLKKASEKKALEESGSPGIGQAVLLASPETPVKGLPPVIVEQQQHKGTKKRKASIGTQTEITAGGAFSVGNRSAPQLAFVPPTPTFQQPSTPPRPASPNSRSAMLVPSDASVTASSKSYPSTPSGSLRDKEREKDAKGRKPRSGSVSIVQRATTALEAAGLVKKKSSEAVRASAEARPRERSRDTEKERRAASGEEPSRSSHGSVSSSKLTRSPPLKPAKEKDLPYPHLPTTPPPLPSHLDSAQTSQMGSPWVLAGSGTESRPPMSVSHPNRLAAPAPINVNAAGETPVPVSISAPNFVSEATSGAGGSVQGNVKATAPPPPRNRASLLQALRLWFHEDKKGKRKDATSTGVGKGINQHVMYAAKPGSAPVGGAAGTKRRGSNGGRFGSRGHRQRPSGSSRRSSSVNSRRSSSASAQVFLTDSPQIPTRRSFGSHTPNSERGDYSSRPSSVQSFSVQHRHKKSPSQSSAGSMHHLRTASPMRMHRRATSGSSTRVVRQSSARPSHARTNSATSSLHSPTSSRPASFYEASETEAPRTSSPFKTRSRRTSEETPRRNHNGGAGGTTFVAQKRQAPFESPAAQHSYGRSSWRKAWGLEPPGWQTRTTTSLPVEVLAVSPAGDQPVSIRDVFSGRPSLSLGMGDESDWVDEDDDFSVFAGGLGQMSASLSQPRNVQVETPEPVIVAPAPRGHRSSLSMGRSSGIGSRGSGGTGVGVSVAGKKAHLNVDKALPVPGESLNTFEPATETRGPRRQLPNARSGPAFRQAIQEEDEDEEEG